jgi:hypothetical protein
MPRKPIEFSYSLFLRLLMKWSARPCAGTEAQSSDALGSDLLFRCGAQVNRNKFPVIKTEMQ